jgi:predicted amidohydrolase
MTRRLRVAVAQMELRPEPSVDAFRAHVASLADAAAKDNAELIVLPEMSTTGLIATHPRADSLGRRDMQEAYRETFPALTEELARMFLELAAHKGMWICGGTHWRRHDDGSYRNTAYVAHPDGRLDTQDKLHLTWPEEAIGTQGGEWIEPFPLGPATVAVQTCADIEFPEVTRAMAEQGAELILCPTLTWNRRGAHRVKYSALARSVEHQVFVAAAPMIGSHGIPGDGALHGTGRAMITTPIDRGFGVNDGILAAAQTDAEEVIAADLDLDQLHESRRSSDTPGLRHARPDLYAKLVQATENASQGDVAAVGSSAD